MTTFQIMKFFCIFSTGAVLNLMGYPVFINSAINWKNTIIVFIWAFIISFIFLAIDKHNKNETNI